MLSAKTIFLFAIGLLIDVATTAQTDPVFRMPQLLDAFYRPAAVDLDNAAGIRIGGRGDQGLGGDDRYAYGLVAYKQYRRLNWSLNYLHDRHVDYLSMSDGNPPLRRASGNDFISVGAAYPIHLGSSVLSIGLRLGVVHKECTDVYTPPVSFTFNPTLNPQGTWKKMTYDLAGGIEYRIYRFFFSAGIYHPTSQSMVTGFPHSEYPLNRICYESIRYRIAPGETTLPIDASITARQSPSGHLFDTDRSIHTIEGNFSVLFFQHIRSGIGVSTNNVQQHPLAVRLGYEQKQFDVMVGLEPLTERGLAGEFTMGWIFPKRVRKSEIFDGGNRIFF